MPDGEKRFRVGGTGDVGPETILHVPGYGDGFKGLSPIGQAREALGLAMSTEEFGARFFGQGSTLSGC
jgi:phage portal protein BeeE